jgi:hypothetical protein
VTSHIVPPSPAMQAKAEVLASQAHTWHRGRSKQDGTPFWIIPGTQPLSAHWANVHGCTCKSYRNRGECSHRLACRILQRQQDAAIVEQVQAADAERQKRYEELFGEDDSPWCADCKRHHVRGQHYAVAIA